MQIILFESEYAKRLRPITLTRPSFSILCGGTTLYDLVKRELRPTTISTVVPAYQRAMVDRRFGGPRKRQEGWLLFLDGTVVPDSVGIQRLSKLVAKKKSFIIRKNGIVAALVNAAEVKLSSKDLSRIEPEAIKSGLRGLNLPAVELDLPRFVQLHEVITRSPEILGSNLEGLRKGLRKVKPDVYVGRKVKISKDVVFDTANGPILIDEGTVVADFVVLRGPLWIGKNCKINSFTELKDGTVIGNVCKVGGEVEAAIIQGYSNKQHFGFLGHSYVGEWVNLGAGTSNSDLKNTYGEIKMQGLPTGRQFLGCVIGDGSRAAIGTQIYTGKVVGVASGLYGTVLDDVPSFTSAGSLLTQPTELPVAVASKAMRAMMARRKVKFGVAEQGLLAAAYDLTVGERKARKVKKGKLVF